jgi:formate dehydrogenase subunit gamma
MADIPIFKDGQVYRFSMAARVLHTVHLVAFVTLLYTGLARMFPALHVLVGSNLTLEQTIHHIAAVVFLAVPIAEMVLFPKGSIEFLKELFSWDSDDTKWMIKFLPWLIRPQAVKLPPQGKEKAGQKFSAWIIIAFCITIAISGVLMWAGQTTGTMIGSWAIVVHDLSFIVLLFIIIMHAYMGLLFPPTMKGITSMITGYIPESEAKHGWSKCYDELKKEAGKA